MVYFDEYGVLFYYSAKYGMCKILSKKRTTSKCNYIDKSQKYYANQNFVNQKLKLLIKSQTS